MRRRLRGSAASRESRARSRRLALLRSTRREEWLEWIGIGGIEFESVCTVHWPRHAITHANHRRGGAEGVLHAHKHAMKCAFPGCGV